MRRISVGGKEICNYQNLQVLAVKNELKTSLNFMGFGELSVSTEQTWQKRQKNKRHFPDGVRLSVPLCPHPSGETYSSASCTAQLSIVKNRKGGFFFNTVVWHLFSK